MAVSEVRGGFRGCIRGAPLVGNAVGRAKSARIRLVPRRALMPYVDRVLQEGEAVRHIARISWVTYLPGLSLWAVAGVLAGILPSETGFYHYLVLFMAAVIFVIGTVLLARAWVQRVPPEIAGTAPRVLIHP